MTSTFCSVDPVRPLSDSDSTHESPNPNTLLWCRSQCGHQTSCLFQRSPNRGAANRLRFSRSRIVDRYHSHNKVPEFLEYSTLERFCRVVANHVTRWAPDDRQFVTLHSIRDEEVADINVFRALAARNLSIRLEKNRALVILVQDIVLDPVTLSIHKIPRPAYRWHEIVCCDHLGLRGAPSVQPVLVRPDNWHSSSQG
jgi:hypothetical protein